MEYDLLSPVAKLNLLPGDYFIKNDVAPDELLEEMKAHQNLNPDAAVGNIIMRRNAGVVKENAGQVDEVAPVVNELIEEEEISVIPVDKLVE